MADNVFQLFAGTSSGTEELHVMGKRGFGVFRLYEFDLAVRYHDLNGPVFYGPYIETVPDSGRFRTYNTV